ncbi:MULTISPECIES: hypothetical protein [unclassified Nonomuraea]|uniref:hypothetical protein n=1 Tax=unclassified Nonomuraea TaxID=2593643 RepID=UPI0033F99B87
MAAHHQRANLVDGHRGRARCGGPDKLTIKASDPQEAAAFADLARALGCESD